MKKIISVVLFLMITIASFSQNDVKKTFIEETQGIVLLKNHGGILPLNQGEISSIAIIGKDIYYSDGSATISPDDPGSITTPLHGISRLAGDSINIYASTSMGQKAIDAAAMADVTIVFVSQPEVKTYLEAYCDISPQSQMIRAIYETNPSTIVVLQTDSAVNIEDWAFDIPAIMQAWMPKAESGGEIASVLFGVEEPEGKMPFTWTMNENQNYEPRFPFGYGLTYTTIGIGKLMMRRERDASGWTATVETNNLGSRTGSEVLQLYINSIVNNLPEAELEIKAYNTVTLLPGQHKTVAIKVPYKRFEQYDHQSNTWVLEPGLYEILVGTSLGEIKLRKTIELKESHIKKLL